jgi:hypothetical protein
MENFGVLVKTKDPVDIGNLFWMDKGLIVIEIGNTITGSTNLIEKLYLTDGTEVVQIFCLFNEIQILKTEDANKSKEITIPYYTNLTNLDTTLTALEIQD